MLTPRFLACLVRRTPRPSSRPTCWVCGTAVGNRYPEDTHGSPLGDAFTLGGCDACGERRAVTEEHAAWFLTLAGAGDATQADPGMLRAVVADGGEWNRPVHVYLEGRYEPLLAWAGSQAGRDVLRSFRERRGVAPGEDARTRHGIGLVRAA